MAKSTMPRFKHSMKESIFLGTFNDHDLYFVKSLESPNGVIARYGDGVNDYFQGISSGELPLRHRGKPNEVILRVAYLIAADFGYVPFKWSGSLEMYPFEYWELKKRCTATASKV